MNRALWLCASLLLLIGIVVFQCSQGYAVVPYTLIEGPTIKSQAINESNSEFVEKLQKHEEQNIQNFEEIKNELIRIKEQNTLIAKEESSWKLITIALFLINFILLAFLGWTLRFKKF